MGTTLRSLVMEVIAEREKTKSVRGKSMILALWVDITELRSEGLSLAVIYAALRDRMGMSISYETFRYHVRRLDQREGKEVKSRGEAQQMSVKTIVQVDSEPVESNDDPPVGRVEMPSFAVKRGPRTDEVEW